MELSDFVLLFCNGEPPTAKRIQGLLPRPKLIACADGGANKATSLGYKPDLVVGDLDSLNPESSLDGVEILRIDSQENTDFEKTLNALLDRGFDRFLVVAFSGGRIDQTLANLQIAYEYSRRCRLVLADDRYVIFPTVKNIGLYVNMSDVSIIPMEDGTTISTKGLEYELRNTLLRKGGQGISNRAKADKIEIMVHKGGALVFVDSPTGRVGFDS